MTGDWENEIHTGNALDLLDEFPEASVHAVVTDPPYGLAFMGRSWDEFEPEEYQEWCEKWAAKALRVLKPGGHLLAFSGNRTHHRLFSGVEDAGFEVRDTLTWHFGNGFPKNTDTLLKPSTEFVMLARKPCGGSATDCYDEHGTAYLNVDACWIGDDDLERRAGRTFPNTTNRPDRETLNREPDNVMDRHQGDSDEGSYSGRYPANAIFDYPAAAVLDAVVGERKSGATPKKRDGLGSDRVFASASGQQDLGVRREKNAGGPSRFFYTSKATASERTLNGKIANGHPTVKPLDLMEWLVKLVTREGQTVLDPFAGTGTTCKAAKDLGRRFVGIEQEEKWADVARVRCGLTPDDPSTVRSDDAQRGLEEVNP